ncbi:hypothetical protein SAMN05444007_1104 [Cribrihabitans marinus]|uniref:Uncharacterized protein n=1 Tax=Cribrihabitans marinus TaxID=1227549 RepID=A0A1H7D5F1_9RHOB|nr:hypothetical protein SAMN05444007_1104 [Cribrihabitans marinus]
MRLARAGFRREVVDDIRSRLVDCRVQGCTIADIALNDVNAKPGKPPTVRGVDAGHLLMEVVEDGHMGTIARPAFRKLCSDEADTACYKNTLVHWAKVPV